jgi:hypothetical protein
MLRSSFMQNPRSPVLPTEMGMALTSKAMIAWPDFVGDAEGVAAFCAGRSQLGVEELSGGWAGRAGCGIAPEHGKIAGVSELRVGYVVLALRQTDRLHGCNCGGFVRLLMDRSEVRNGEFAQNQEDAEHQKQGRGDHNVDLRA